MEQREETMEKIPYLEKGTSMTYTITNYKALLDIRHMIPDSVLCGSSDYVPGIVNEYLPYSLKIYNVR